MFTLFSFVSFFFICNFLSRLKTIANANSAECKKCETEFWVNCSPNKQCKLLANNLHTNDKLAGLLGAIKGAKATKIQSRSSARCSRLSRAFIFIEISSRRRQSSGLLAPGGKGDRLSETQRPPEHLTRMNKLSLRAHTFSRSNFFDLYYLAEFVCSQRERRRERFLPGILHWPIGELEIRDKKVSR